MFPDNVLRLRPFIGAPTEHVFIGVGNGVCGTAVAERRNINVPDVNVTNYLACSTETRSELVIIRSGERIHAQIDIDSHGAAFDDSAVAQVQEIADWLAGLTTPAWRQAARLALSHGAADHPQPDAASLLAQARTRSRRRPSRALPQRRWS